ncbi:hypothetical protein C475_12245 [Halosimplex carlsbadense 2-9-1]|uniref:DUF2064 domain-containing protein n=1 Tax=Halosimplex carlsbadense 2-9-1 TaxID=797114 RepID=M0CRN2_9EURY|nr:hypothetical protein [Halosimplex carlsbadense]ELZ24509.1 hypothetical protein C475_12245 [Halosimplex carlsbadense 2-9-1]
MTTVALLVRPAEPGTVLEHLVDSGAVTAEEAADLYAAMARDVAVAVRASGADLLVNYRPVDADDPTEPAEDEASLEAVRSLLAPALDDPDDPRYEVQVGSSLSARVGNTVTHLLDREGVQSAAVARPAAAMLQRRIVDSAAMKLRGSEVVLGPATDGRVSYAAFTEPVDFEDAFAQPAVETLTDRGRDAGLDVDFLEMLPVAETAGGFAALVSQIRARRRADLWVPSRTAAVVADLGLVASADDGGITVGRD